MTPAYNSTRDPDGIIVLKESDKLRCHTSSFQNRLRSKSESSSFFVQGSLTTQVTNGELGRSRERLLRTQRSRPQPSIICKFTRQQILALLTLTLAEFISFASMSVMAPFFPREAAEKGMSTSVSGFVFSFYAFVVFATSPVFGKILPAVGAKFLFMAGMFLAGGCNILFGVLPLMENYATFVFYCFTIRTLEAIGASAYSTASFVFVVEIFPENISAVLGVLETAMGLGMSAGPAIGGMLFAIGGFGLPFYVLGALMIVLIPCTWALLPLIEGSAKGSEHASFSKLFKIPSVIIIGSIIIVASNTWSFLDPTLEPHLSLMNLSSYHVGLIFLLFASLYGIFSPIWGWVADKMDNHWSMMVIGLILSSIGLLMLGPSPLLEMEMSLWLDIFGLCLIGISVALTLMPTFKAILKCAEENGLRKELSTYSIVAGAWSCMYSLGDMTGPALGGVISEYFGFPTCTTAMAALSLFTALVATLYFTSRCTHPADDYEDEYEYEDTQIPLLSDKEGCYGCIGQTSNA
ncbi:MFS-type transporter SLC18B1-like [Cimex lectularius]|uniref:Major facilitator superfamily (MFS) profile domain-containing protein n=1 Tax=Cimex lectularius TaxID=79782 RepID=A0A8I6RLV4_CIMLE|nr:MFS-type transporter SLC18B1-like [Cimex lectularius]